MTNSQNETSHPVLFPPAVMILPSTTSSQVNSGDGFPMKGTLWVLFIAALVSCRGKGGFLEQGRRRHERWKT
ncbi:MAG: hypothetical protein Q7J35_01135 [Candidatus Methanoperedens sp.]|nr:hypothetical protein [Candidatus Methanoperedens sp.]